MPDDNRFAGLSDVVEDDESTEPADADAGVELSHEDSTHSSETDTEATTDEDAGADAQTETAVAFPFDETTKKTVYVRKETLDSLEDARALADARLRTEHDVRDLTGREFYDAAFRLAAADTDGLIEEILRERSE